jgi:hypothetical protein
MDSLQISVTNGTYSKTFTSKLKDLKESDTLKIEKKSGSILPFRDAFVIKSKTPIVSIDESKITLRNKDSVVIKFTSKHIEFDEEIVFDFKKDEEEKYTIELLPGAIKDFYDTENDSLKYNFSTKQLSDYGNLKINLSNVKRFPFIIELLDKNEVLYKATSTKETSIYFETIEPKLYTLRIIFDDNANNEWDTGDYLAKKQAEEIIYFPKLIDVRANWDVEQDFILD